MAKLSALSNAMTSFKYKCQTIWLIAKQVWFVPFFWSLAWYSYWIFRSAIVFNTPLLQINAVDYLGATISIVALLIAGYRAREPIKRSVGIAADIGINVKKALSPTARDHLKGNSPIRSSSQKLVQSTQPKTPKQLKPVTNLQQPVKTRLVQREIGAASKPLQLPSNASIFSSNVNRYSQNQPSKDFSAECLTCAKLVTCTNRQRRAVELKSQGQNASPCRFATDIPQKDLSIS